MNTTTPSKSEPELLKQAAQLIGFKYLMYVPEIHPHKGGLLYLNAARRQQVWNPSINDDDLLQLAVAMPGVNLDAIITKASEIGGDEVSRLAYVPETFLRMVTGQSAAVTDTVPAAETANIVS